jgi:hypothetical protein
MQMNTGKEQQDETMNCGLNVMESDLLQTKLRELADTMPPREVWQRIEQQARAEGLLQSQWHARTRWFAGTGVAAAVVLAVLNIPLTPSADDGATGFPTEPDITEFADSANSQNLTAMTALMVQSQQIERDLRALPTGPSVVRAGTAVTIAELQDHIAAIDFTLNHPDLVLTPEQEQIYWRERVRLMNSLLSLRTAQAQRMSF